MAHGKKSILKGLYLQTYGNCEIGNHRTARTVFDLQVVNYMDGIEL